MDIDELLVEDRTEIVQHAWRSVSMLKHYERDGREVTLERIEALYDHIAQAIRTRDLCELLDHAERIAKQRFEARFELAEVQTAFFMIEEAIWRRVLARIPPEGLAEALGLVSTAVTRGKDAFARAYIAVANQSRVPSLDLSDLFKGT
jgi:hypothetical protein